MSSQPRTRGTSTHILHFVSGASFNDVSSARPCLTTISLIARFNSSELNRPWTRPLIVTRCLCFWKILSDSKTYESMHSSTVIRSRPSMIAMSLRFLSAVNSVKQSLLTRQCWCLRSCRSSHKASAAILGRWCPSAASRSEASKGRGPRRHRERAGGVHARAWL
jgi:hypothetical protein